MFTSTIQILKVSLERSKSLNPETQKPYETLIARTALLNDDGELETVGRLRVPRELADVSKEETWPKVGTYRAAFALRVPDYGKEKGDVIAQLVGLTNVNPATVSGRPAVKAA